MIQTFLLDTQMIWMTYIKILKNKIKIKNEKILITFGGMIADTLSNKKT